MQNIYFINNYFTCINPIRFTFALASGCLSDKIKPNAEASGTVLNALRKLLAWQGIPVIIITQT